MSGDRDDAQETREIEDAGRRAEDVGGPRSGSGAVQARLFEMLTQARREVGERESEATVSAARARRLESELERQRRRADILVRIGTAVNSVRELPSLLQLVVNLAVEAAGAERGLVVVRDDSGVRREYSATKNLDSRLVAQPEFRVSRSIIDRVLRDGRFVSTTDAQNDPELATSLSIRSLHIRSIICAPIRSPEGINGVIYLDSRLTPDSVVAHDPDLVATIADQAAIAIDNARLYEHLSRSFVELTSIKTQNEEILEAIASGLVVLDGDGTIVQFNRAAEMTFGLSANTMLGRHARILNTWVPGFSTLLDRAKASAERSQPVEVTGTHFVRGAIVLQLSFFRIHDRTTNAPGLAVVVNDVTESRNLRAEADAEVARRERIERTFERYVAPHIVAELVRNPDALPLGGTRLRATMLFADIRGFTQLAAGMLPEAVVELLNRYLERTVNVIFANGGLLDKFYGDGVLAVFGAPVPRDDDPQRAVLAATQLLEQVKLLNAAPGVKWPLSVGIGLATGEVVAGHIGSEKRVEYTVIGDAVNLASRLQAIAEPNQILADEVTYDAVRSHITATRRLAHIKGKAGETPVYLLHG